MLLAHDLGTTGAKGSLYSSGGELLAEAFWPYETRCEQPGWAEQDPEAWWDAVCANSRALLDRVPGAAAQLAGISFSGMMNGVVLVDERGHPVHPALIHADVRSAALCGELEQHPVLQQSWEVAGNHVAPYFTLAKLAWLQRRQPEVLRAARWCLQAKDYAGGLLTGEWGVTDPSDASLTGCWDLRRREWWGEGIQAAGLPQGILPRVLPSTAVLGHVTPASSQQTGLPTGLPVVVGGGDGACATAGAGVTSPGEAYLYVGSSAWIGSLVGQFHPDATRRIPTLAALGSQPGQGPAVYYATTQSAGAAVDWCRELLGYGSRPFEAFEALSASAPAGCDGLLFLPYLTGERSPLWDNNARGVFFGLTPRHGPAHLARSVFEGVAMAFRSNLDAVRPLTGSLETLRVLGGGVRSRLWRQITAAVLDVPLQPLKELSAASSTGAILAAAVGLGLYSDFASAAAVFVRPGPQESPDPGLREAYEPLQSQFAGLYEALREPFRRSAGW